MSNLNEIIEAVNEAERMRGAYIDSQEYARDCRFLINKLSEKVAEREQLIIDNEKLTDQLNQAIEALKTVIYHPSSHAYVRVIADNALTYIKEGETDATQTSSRS